MRKSSGAPMSARSLAVASRAGARVGSVAVSDTETLPQAPPSARPAHPRRRTFPVIVALCALPWAWYLVRGVGVLQIVAAGLPLIAAGGAPPAGADAGGPRRARPGPPAPAVPG